MDIFTFIGTVLDLDLYHSVEYVKHRFGIGKIKLGFKPTPEDEEEEEYLLSHKQATEEPLEVSILDQSILNTYYDLYYSGWIKEGISINTMKRFNIKMSILDHQIIIPHFDMDGNLIGVRCRNLDKNLVDAGKKYMPVKFYGQILKHPTGQFLYGLNIAKPYIDHYHKIILFEAEKSVLQMASMFPHYILGVSLSGSNLTKFQVDQILKCNVHEVVIALDKEFDDSKSREAQFYMERIKAVFYEKLKDHGIKVSVIWDTQNLLNKKDSPSDHGTKIFNQLLKNRIEIK
jgi:hypothetical protein